MISQPPVKDYVPFSWASLVHVKKEHYQALAHFYVAVGLVDHTGEFTNKTIETLQFLHEESEDKTATLIEIRVPKHANEKRYLGKELLEFERLFQELYNKKITHKFSNIMRILNSI